MVLLIKNGIVLTPENIGKKDVLIAGNKIEQISDNIEIHGIEHKTIDAKNCYVIPGLIDGHVHICGGGGEGGYKTRTPEIMLSDITTAGITSVVGVIGTDGTMRTMSNLLAKAYALEEEGVSTYTYTGSYQVPVRTLTGNVTDDIILVEKIIGVGEVALSDHRSSVPTVGELTRIASDARLGGMLSGKSGIVNLHMGDNKNPLDIINKLLDNTSIPRTQFLPTHMNRNEYIFKEAIEYAQKGGYVDFTTSTVPQFVKDGEIPASEAVKLMIKSGVNIENITISSDGQGSLPMFDSNGNLKGLEIGKSKTVLETIKQMYFDEGMNLEDAIKTATSNPAKILKLKDKGNIIAGYDADITILKVEDLSVKTVLCKGRIMVNEGKPEIMGTFEQE